MSSTKYKAPDEIVRSVIQGVDPCNRSPFHNSPGQLSVY